jgi:hypothetical protein
MDQGEEPGQPGDAAGARGPAVMGDLEQLLAPANLIPAGRASASADFSDGPCSGHSAAAGLSLGPSPISWFSCRASGQPTPPRRFAATSSLRSNPIDIPREGPHTHLPAASFPGGFRTTAPVQAASSRWAVIRTLHIKRRQSMSVMAAAFAGSGQGGPFERRHNKGNSRRWPVPM